MSRTVYLHIGAPKTGTTYLQDRLTRNASQLAQHDVHYPSRSPLISPPLFHFRAALDLLRAGNEYDLLLCDLMIPGMTGMELCTAIERQFPNAARRMAEFCYLIKRPLNVEAFVYPPDAGKTNEIPYGSGLIAIPVYKSIAEATKNHPTINTSLVYIGADRAMKGGMEALDDSHIKVVSMITEGVPEKDAKLLGAHARKLGKVFNGPSSIGVTKYLPSPEAIGMRGATLGVASIA